MPWARRLTISQERGGTYAAAKLRRGVVIYTAERMSEILRAAGVKLVCMRYGGSEGRGGVSQVNFLKKTGGFLGYADIQKARLPETEVFALGEEMIVHCKKDWLDDWGGHGELRWVLGQGVSIVHQDRRVVTDEMDLSMPEDTFARALSTIDLPHSEMASLSEIRAEFEVEWEKVTFDRIRPGGDGPSASQPLVEGARQLFTAAIGEALKDRQWDAARGLVRWRLQQEVEVSMEVDREVFEEMRFTIPDVSVISLPARNDQES